MTTWPALVGAGVAAGLAGTITGVGSVFSYPVLLAVGLPPTAANVTNTVALALGGVGGAVTSRPEAAGRSRLTVRLGAASALGTLVGSALLLASPPSAFETVVPFLIALASLSILLPRPGADTGSEGTRGVGGASAAMGVVSIYNGYFAAGSAVLMVAALLLTTTMTLRVANGLKNVLVLISDLAAALAFAVFGPVSWAAVPPLALGLLLGTALGPPIARRLPVPALRILIAVAGVGLAVVLALRTF